MLTQSVKQYRDELFELVEQRSRTEQWTQIQDAFQVVGSKFEELDSQRKEDLEVSLPARFETRNFIGDLREGE